VTLIALGGKAGEWLADRAGLGQVYAVVWAWSRWPITMLLIMFVTAVLYYFLPDVEQEWRFITPGSVVGTLLWLLATWAFTQYAEHFAKYDAAYGSIGGMIVAAHLALPHRADLHPGRRDQRDPRACRARRQSAGRTRGGEAPPPPEARPSAAAPGAAKQRTAAIRSHLRLLQRRKERRGGRRAPPTKSRKPRPTSILPIFPRMKETHASPDLEWIDQLWMVNVPVKLFSATSPKEVRFHMVHDKDGGRIQQKRVCSVDGEEVPWEHIVKGFEISKGATSR